MNFRLTLKAWPVITAVTIGLCFATQGVAKLFGIDLPEQQNVEIVRQWLLHAFDSAKTFMTVAFLLAQILILLPALEELIFRGFLTKLPIWMIERKKGTKDARRGMILLSVFGVTSSILFSAAHYLAQPWPDSAFLALFLFGLAQCWLYRKTNRIWCAMLNHALFNLTNVVLLLIIPAAK